MNYDNYPPLPEPDHGPWGEHFTADKVREAQREMARECYLLMLDCGHMQSAHEIEERFGPFDE